MTGASKLFYNWRSRAGRNPEPDLGLDSISLDRDPNLRRHRHGHGHGHGSRLHPRPAHLNGRHINHRVTQTECESKRFDRGSTGEFGTGNSNNGGVTISAVSRLGLIRNDPLPDAVLQARARLLERLRSVSLMGSRQTTRVSVISRDEFAVRGDFTIDNVVDWGAETPRDWFDSNIPHVEFAVQTDETPSFHDESKKQPPLGLSWEALCSLKHEVFRNSEDGEASGSQECCICLESFWEGDEVVRLHCGHMYHPLCLEPWVRRACGDCPYCRANIIC